MRSNVRLRYGLFALAVAIGLSGCSSAKFAGLSTYGNNKLTVAEVSNIDSYTADGALTEARGHFRNADYGYSAAFYKHAVEMAPKDAEGYVGLGASYDRLGRFDLADRVYASLYALSGGTAQYYNNVGYSYMLRGNMAGALANFRKAERLEPDNLVIANNIQILARAAQSRA